jgi:hypothetical protein
MGIMDCYHSTRSIPNRPITDLGLTCAFSYQYNYGWTYIMYIMHYAHNVLSDFSFEIVLLYFSLAKKEGIQPCVA